jgi:hypothetical protein
VQRQVAGAKTIGENWSGIHKIHTFYDVFGVRNEGRLVFYNSK